MRAGPIRPMYVCVDERRREEATTAGEAAAGLRRGTRARRSTRDRTDAADEVFQRMVKGRR